MTSRDGLVHKSSSKKGSSDKNNSDIWFVLEEKRKGSLFFGDEFQACFQGEEPALLFSLPLLDHGEVRDLSLIIETGQRCIILPSQIKKVSITYDQYSFLILWLLEQGLVIYPSELLAIVLEKMRGNRGDHSIEDNLKIFKDSLESTLHQSNFKTLEVAPLERPVLYTLSDKKSKKATLGIKKTKAMFSLLRQVLFLHLRGGWMPEMNEKIEGGLGSLCRSVLFPKSFQAKEKSAPAFDAGTDGNLVCVTDFEWSGERVYFDPNHPLDVIYLMNRLSAKPSPENGQKYTIGVEDRSIITIPLQEGHLMEHMFTPERLGKDKRFQQLTQGATSERSMPKDTKIISYLEYLYFISALKTCQNLAGVTHDLFDLLYTKYILPCQLYNSLHIIDYLSGRGWKTLSRSEGNGKIFSHVLDLTVGARYPMDMMVWVHGGPSSSPLIFKEDSELRFVPSLAKIGRTNQILK